MTAYTFRFHLIGRITSQIRIHADTPDDARHEAAAFIDAILAAHDDTSTASIERVEILDEHGHNILEDAA